LYSIVTSINLSKRIKNLMVRFKTISLGTIVDLEIASLTCQNYRDFAIGNHEICRKDHSLPSHKDHYYDEVVKCYQISYPFLNQKLF
jgi:hypothetical protein